MKITVYELLGLVKDGKAPKIIKTNDGDIFYYDETEDNEITRYKNINDCLLVDEYYLNDEIEILEEEKKIPEKIKDKYYSQISKVELAQKYNEIIDYLDYLKSKGE